MFSATLSRIVIVPNIAIASVTQKVQDRDLNDAETRAFARHGLDTPVAEIELVHRARPKGERAGAADGH